VESGGLHVDVGTGDGAFVYKSAFASPERFFVGIDANGDGLVGVSRRAAAKPSRGGVPNTLFVLAAVEALPAELAGLAGSVTVLFPWGSLLRSVAVPVPETLRSLRTLCREGAELHVVFGYEVAVERKPIEALGLPEATDAHLQRNLVPAFASAGFDVRVSHLARAELETLPTTWAKRLRFGRNRTYWKIRGRAV
jgi:16S rRNA (adenine(1408)-N(1))-methyltransferase